MLYGFTGRNSEALLHEIIYSKFFSLLSWQLRALYNAQKKKNNDKMNLEFHYYKSLKKDLQKVLKPYINLYSLLSSFSSEEKLFFETFSIEIQQRVSERFKRHPERFLLFFRFYITQKPPTALLPAAIDSFAYSGALSNERLILWGRIFTQRNYISFSLQYRADIFANYILLISRKKRPNLKEIKNFKCLFTTYYSKLTTLKKLLRFSEKLNPEGQFFYFKITCLKPFQALTDSELFAFSKLVYIADISVPQNRKLLQLFPDYRFRVVPEAYNFSALNLSFCDLVKHMFVRYEMPDGMAENFLNFSPDDINLDIFWQIANGSSLRKMPLPFPITRRESHIFINHSSFEINNQPTALHLIIASKAAARGASSQLIDTLADSFLIRHNASDLPVFEKYMDFFVRTKTPTDLVVPLLDYFYFMDTRFGYSLTGKSLNREMQRMNDWHAGRNVLIKRSWAQKFPKKYFSSDGKISNPEIAQFYIVELGSTEELMEESNKLNHCVGRTDYYCRGCQEERFRILSLRDSKDQSILTIQYDQKNQTFLQVRGFNNRLPGKEENFILEQWIQNK